MNQSFTLNPNASEARSAKDGAARIAFVQSCWHKDIVDRARESFTAEIAKRGIPKDAVDFFEVPGA
jgi:6,7-dimethyl-8-ribityllumazine synthase